ncbi:MAG: hypothetical protein R2828_02435 [Saprospiraceae bacterium]
MKTINPNIFAVAFISFFLFSLWNDFKMPPIFLGETAIVKGEITESAVALA